MRWKKFVFAAAAAFVSVVPCLPAQAAPRIRQFRAKPPIHVFRSGGAGPAGLSPEKVRAAYGLPSDGGRGTIAIVAAFDSPSVQKDLGVFSSAFKLPPCTAANGCFEKHKMAAKMKTDHGWALETALDTQWSHAIAPRAKILLVEAKSGGGEDLLAAVDYASSRPDVVAVSMSWGGTEFSGETDLDQHFAGKNGTAYFAASGDNGTGASWPAASPNVVAVGGTTLKFAKDGRLEHETAWTGSGGGVSAFEPQPDYQKAYDIARAHGMRAIPDVAYAADPASGFSVYLGTNRSWYVVGGTSAGAPQWAAIRALGLSAENAKFYTDKASPQSAKYSRDILSGSNGACGYFCSARRRYDYVTGLGSPLTVDF